MDTINVGYRNNDEVAHSVYEYIKDFTNYGQKYALRPFDFHHPEDTAWWFIPGDEWPAYKYAKLIIQAYPPFRTTSGLFMGYHVEHGFPQSLQVQEVTRTKTMKVDWDWFKFLKQVEIGKIYETIRKVRENTNAPTRLFIDVQTPSLEHFSWAEYEFTWVIDQLNILASSQDSLESMILEKSFKKLLRQISLSPEINFFWLDIYIGVLAVYGKQGSISWKAKDIWYKTLEPWCEVILAG